MSNILKQVDVNIIKDNNLKLKSNSNSNNSKENNNNKDNNSSKTIIYKENELLEKLYKDVAAIARSLGLKYNGKKVEIVERIIQFQKEQLIVNKLNKIKLNKDNSQEEENVKEEEDGVFINQRVDSDDGIEDHAQLDNFKESDSEEEKEKEEEEEVLNTSLSNNYHGSSDEEHEYNDQNNEEEDDDDYEDEEQLVRDQCRQYQPTIRRISPLLQAASPSKKIIITKKIQAIEKDENGRLLVINYDSSDGEDDEDEENIESFESVTHSDDDSVHNQNQINISHHSENDSDSDYHTEEEDEGDEENYEAVSTSATSEYESSEEENYEASFCNTGDDYDDNDHYVSEDSDSY